MKKRYIILCCLYCFLLFGCISINYTNYRSTETLEGKGGSVFNKYGIDFWENGEPDQKYKIIGIIDYKANDLPIQNARSNKKIAKKVIEVSGDAVILFNEEKENRGSINSGNARGDSKNFRYSGTSTNIIRKYRKYYVIRYL